MNLLLIIVLSKVELAPDTIFFIIAASATPSTSKAYVIPILTASNYATWQIKIQMLLTRSELWDVVDGTEVAPPISDIVGTAT